MFFLDRLDQKLRRLWAFWDTHGTRLLGIAAILFNSVSAAAVVFTKASPETAAILLGIGAVGGVLTHARGSSNATTQPDGAP